MRGTEKIAVRMDPLVCIVDFHHARWVFFSWLLCGGRSVNWGMGKAVIGEKGGGGDGERDKDA